MLRAIDGKWLARDLVDGTVAGDDKALDLWAFEGDGAKGLLVLLDVMTEDVQEGFGLLGTEVDALEVVDANLVWGMLVDGAEDQEEVPDGEPYLHTVGVGVAIVR